VARGAAGGVGGALKDRTMSLPSRLANNCRLRWAAVRELHGSAWWNKEPLIWVAATCLGCLPFVVAVLLPYMRPFYSLAIRAPSSVLSRVSPPRAHDWSRARRAPGGALHSVSHWIVANTALHTHRHHLCGVPDRPAHHRALALAKALERWRGRDPRRSATRRQRSPQSSASPDGASARRPPGRPERRIGTREPAEHHV
jgi:hypothetical protein